MAPVEKASCLSVSSLKLSLRPLPVARASCPCLDGLEARPTVLKQGLGRGAGLRDPLAPFTKNLSLLRHHGPEGQGGDDQQGGNEGKGPPEVLPAPEADERAG